MKILFIAPQPFYQERGTPINVDLVLTALSQRGDVVDLLVYHEGEDREYPNIKLHRIKPFFPIKNLQCGFSVKKVLADIFIFFKAIKLVKEGNYDLIHAGEEAAFIALFIKWYKKIPYIYDMDSLLSRQMIGKMKLLKKVEKQLLYMESLAVKNALGIAPVCKALEEDAQKLGGKNIISWEDISLRKEEISYSNNTDIRKHFSIENSILMYIGNLERYQGIHLLLESFAIALKKVSMTLVIIGGQRKDIDYYKNFSTKLGIDKYVRFLGTRPSNLLFEFMNQANALVSPRTLGFNTPMKIYSYLHSGIPVLATNLYTHTQVVSSENTVLAEPEKSQFAKGIVEVITNKGLREKVSKNAVKFIEENHTYDILKNKINSLYNIMQKEITVEYE